MEIINNQQTIKTLKKWNARLYDSHEICPYCGMTKKDYVDPDTGLLSPLACECEKKLKALEEARDGIINTQFNLRSKVNNNESKLSHDDKVYLFESEKTLDKINTAIASYRVIKLEER